MYKRFIFLLVIIYSYPIFAQIGLPIQQASIPRNNLVVNYDFSKSTSFTRGSSTVTNIAGTASGSATLVQSPNFMNSLGYISFNGTNQYLVTPNLRTHFKVLNNSIQKSFTMCVWVYPTKLNGVIVSELDSQTPSGGWHATNIEIVNGIIYYRIWNGTSITSLNSLSLNQWYHLALVYDGVKLKAYLNGVLQGSRTNDRELPTLGQYYTLAASETTHMGSGGVNGGFHCAQFKLFQLPLSDNDIQQEYNLRKDEFDYTIHSPSTNTNPTYWSVSSVWSGDLFYANAPFPTTTDGYHFTPWINSPQGWSAQTNNTSQNIVLKYDEPVYIKGIVTQGRNGISQWVTSANIETSITGDAPWTPALTNQTLNTNITDDIRLLFSSPVFAKSVRVSPTNYSGHITMRMGLLVKPNIYNTTGLVLRLDPSNLKSFSGSGNAFNDLSSNSINFTLASSPPTYDANGFFTFNGTNQYASTAHTNIIKPTSEITLEQWLNADNWNAGSYGGIYQSPLSCTEGGGYSHNIWGGFFESFIFARNSYRTVKTSVSSLTGWNHFVTTFDGRYTRLYLNGVLKDSNDIGISGSLISYASTSNSLILGAEASSGSSPSGSYWKGKIGQTQIYNRALSASEVLQNFSDTKIKYGL